MEKISLKQGLLALSPLMVFLGLYVVLSLVEHDFYAVPVTVAFMVASVWGVAIVKGGSLDERVRVFSRGAAESDLLLMVWIFILAGAFASSAKAIGSIQATVDMCLMVLPSQLILASMFLAACFISLSVGTSVGTIVALVPITHGMAVETGSSVAMMVAVVVGGAFFGDNLSFISDTTIVATKTQGCQMADKFRANVRIALPAALIVLLIYIFAGTRMEHSAQVADVNWLLVLPYMLVLVTAVMGLNVLTVLALGIACTGILGTWLPEVGFFAWFKSMGEGIMGMSELIIVTLMAAGMVGVIRHLGGIDFLLQRLTRGIKGRRGAELAIALLAVLTDVCTANNTIAILTVGPLARDISRRYGIEPKRTASILDTFSCFAQGLIPYGAQLLIASGLAQINPLEIIPYLYYPMVLGACALVAILKKK